ncbi:XdhC family protein [Ornithinimicrobium sp. LYQ92]|uniref:XdhC family protein n=1 Tax=Serinicoccus sp. LYQ92 TaxID=3378798 RepID=UPI003852B5F8
MRDVLDRLLPWWEDGSTVALATVVGTWRSAPRQPGAAMLVGVDGEAVGSVSGGCVEGAVYELGRQVIDTGEPVLQRYGVSDDEAMGVGLTCGGILDVYVERLSRADFPELGEVAADIAAGRPVTVATVVEHPDPTRLGTRLVVRPEGVPSSGSLGSGRADSAVTDDARGMLAQGRTATLEYGPDGERRGDGMRVFVASYAPRPRMLVFGAIDFAAAVARIGSFLGYEVTVCDARPVFATRSRFPDADEVVVSWPHRYVEAQLAEGALDSRTVACVLTHDPKFDVPLLQVLLGDGGPQLAYIGAMGSRRTHEDRLARLREVGLTPEQLAPLRSPVGLDLGARTPEETAVSIAAEIIALRWGGGGEPLRETTGAIHRHTD